MSEISSAMRAICEEKGLSYEAVLETIESALAAAYRKDFGQKNQNVKVEFDPESLKTKIYDVKTVVEDIPEEELAKEEDEEGAEKAEDKPEKKADKDEGKKEKDTEKKETKEEGEGEEEEERRFNPKNDIQISDAKLLKKTAKIGDVIKTRLEAPESYGRMAAQTAKQVIVQRLREAEREMVFNEFKDKEGEVVSGVIQRREGRVVLIDIGKSVGVLPMEEQIGGERYNSGERIKVYVKEVRQGAKGAEVILSRTSEEILKKVFYLEIPEIANGLIELKSVAREAGSRSKVAVYTDSDNVDPVGSCVGQRGARIQTIINELGGEKVDIIEYDEDPMHFVSNALSPAKIVAIDIDEKENKAKVKVSSDQLSLAIGKNGQNARLAARLTNWKIDIVEDGASEKVEKNDKKEEDNDEDSKNKMKKEDLEKENGKSKNEEGDANSDEADSSEDEKSHKE